MTRKLDARMRMAIAMVATMGTVFSCVGILIGGPQVALSIAIGGAIAVVNLYVMARIIASMIPRASSGPAPRAPSTGPAGPPPAPMNPRGAGIGGVLAFVKMNVLFFGIWYLMARGVVTPIALLAGYISLPFGIAIGSLVSDKTVRD